MEKIHITDLTRLKITKVSPWKVQFIYDNIEYSLTSNNRCFILYKIHRYEIRNPQYECINKKINSSDISYFIKDNVSKTKPLTLTYSNIDREYFVKKLIENNFATGLYEKEYNKFLEQKKEIKMQIENLEKELETMNSDWNKTSGHGSKCYQKNDMEKQKIEEYER